MVQCSWTTGRTWDFKELIWNQDHLSFLAGDQNFNGFYMYVVISNFLSEIIFFLKMGMVAT